MTPQLKILFLTTEWPTPERPADVPFLVEYANALRRHGAEVNVFHFHGEGNPINYLKAWVRLRRLPAWRDADILHAHWGQSAFLALGSWKPLVITFHGSDLQGIVDASGRYGWKGKLLVQLNKWMACKATRCLTVSNRLRNLLPPCVHDALVIPMGIDLERFRPLDRLECKRALGLDPNLRYILFASDPARPEKRNGLAERAVAAANLPGGKLLVVSGQPYEKMPLFLNAADLLLLTSSHEGSPMVIKEALACNLPVVSTDVGDVAEKLRNLAGCHICIDDSVKTISSAIFQVMTNPRVFNGREQMQELSWDLIAQQTFDVYHQCLEKHP